MSPALAMIKGIIDEFNAPSDTCRHEKHCPQPLCAITPDPTHHQEPTQGMHDAHDQQRSIR
jgi:hypothetical protein